MPIPKSLQMSYAYAPPVPSENRIQPIYKINNLKNIAHL